MSMVAWEKALIAIAIVIVGCLLVRIVLQLWARNAYQYMLNHPKTSCDIDAFVDAKKNPVNAVKVVLMTKTLSLGNRKASTEAIEMEVYPSPHVPGLCVTRKLSSSNNNKTTSPRSSTQEQATAAAASSSSSSSSSSATPLTQVLAGEKQAPIVVATMRMGFGHHRLAYSACSWAIKTGRKVIFHDLLSIDSDESDLVKSSDAMYSKCSRYASECGGIIEKVWGSAMMQGDADALRMAALTAAHLQPLLWAFPKDTPIITTHQLVALTASACGFTNVINLVVDNHPQWFLTVPNTMNLVQGPVNYQSFLKMGVSSREMAWAGHWCPYDLVSNITMDCQVRIDRRRNAHPLRLLIPVGGAGAQRSFIISLVEALAPLVQAGKVQLLLNAGDHAHMKTAFQQLLDQAGLEFDTVTDSAGVNAFQAKFMLEHKTTVIPKGVTLFSFEEYFPAVATTDLLCRVADVLVCKPSELAFYCIPKLHIRRVGDHEADSAKRSSEMGDGTIEARKVEDAIRFCALFDTTDLLVSMNQAIMENHKIGIYNGCEQAVTRAVERNQTQQMNE